MKRTEQADRSDGALALAELCRIFKRVHIARACGVSQPSLTAWTQGRATPNESNQAVLESDFGIPRSLWSTRGHVKIPAATPRGAHLSVSRQNADQLHALSAERGVTVDKVIGALLEAHHEQAARIRAEAQALAEELTQPIHEGEER